MMWFFAVLIVLAMGGVAVVAAGRGGSMVEEYGDAPDVGAEAGPLTATSLRQVRFTTALRGYDTGEVDELLRRLATQLEQLAGDETGRESGSPPVDGDRPDEHPHQPGAP